MSHELPIKKLILGISRVTDLWTSHEKFRDIATYEIACKIFVGQIWVTKHSVQSWKTWELNHLNSRLGWDLYHSQNELRKHPKNLFFTQNQLKNFEKHGWYKSLPNTIKLIKNLFGLIHIWLSTHTPHLNMNNHTNEISIHWTLDLCVVYRNQVWISP